MAVKSSYPTLRPGPSTYQSSGRPSLDTEGTCPPSGRAGWAPGGRVGVFVPGREMGDGAVMRSDSRMPVMLDRRRAGWARMLCFCFRLKLRGSCKGSFSGGAPSSTSTKSTSSSSLSSWGRRGGGGRAWADCDDEDDAPSSRSGRLERFRVAMASNWQVVLASHFAAASLSWWLGGKKTGAVLGGLWDAATQVCTYLPTWLPLATTAETGGRLSTLSVISQSTASWSPGPGSTSIQVRRAGARTPLPVESEMPGWGEGDRNHNWRFFVDANRTTAARPTCTMLVSDRKSLRIQCW